MLLALAESLTSLIDSYLKLYLEFAYFSELRGDLALIVFGLACLVWVWTIALPAPSNRLALFASLTIVILNLTDCFFMFEENRHLVESVTQFSIMSIICVLHAMQTNGSKKVTWKDYGVRLTGSLVSVLIFIGISVYTLSKGFLLLTPSGLFSVEYEYQLADKTVRLIPMIHVGDEAYFSEVSEYVNQSGNLILIEGITFLNNAAMHTVQKPSALVHQKSAFTLSNDVFVPDGNKFYPAPQKREATNFIWSDVSSSVLSENTIGALLNEKELLTQSDWDIYDFEVISLRNARLLAHIEHAPSGNTILVPWGAAHMPELHTQLTKTGYVHNQSHIRKVVGISGLVTLIRQYAIEGQTLE